MREPGGPFIIPKSSMMDQPHIAPDLSQWGETILTYLQKLHSFIMGNNKAVLQEPYKDLIEFFGLPFGECSCLSSFLSISEIHDFMDSLEKETIPESERFEQR